MNLTASFDKRNVDHMEQGIDEAVVTQEPIVEEIVLEEPVSSPTAEPHADIEPDASPTPDQRISKLEEEINNKDKVIEEMRQKVAVLEKGKNDLQKKLDIMTSDTNALERDNKKAHEKVQLYCNENTELKAKISQYQKHEAANKELQRKKAADFFPTKSTSGEEENPEEILVLEEENLEEIQVLAQNKVSGYRRDGPAAPVRAGPSVRPAPVSQPQTGLFSCSWPRCPYKTKDEVRLQPHWDLKHKKHEEKCDVCNSVFESAFYLRAHLRDAHNKVNGAMMQCTICHFSALNASHLKRHQETHKNANKKKNLTCKYWARGSCTKAQCQFKHERVVCKYGSNCRKGSSCHFEHQNTTENRRHTQQHHVRSPQTNPPWINPAFSDQVSYNQQFPF